MHASSFAPLCPQIIKNSAGIIADDKLLARVCDEAAFQYSMRDNTNIVRVFGVLLDKAAGVLGIVLERCACSLADVLYGPQAALAGPISLATKLDIMLQVERGVRPLLCMLLGANILSPTVLLYSSAYRSRRDLRPSTRAARHWCTRI